MDQKILDKLIHFTFSSIATQEELDFAYSMGLIKKENLEDRCFYLGDCRNAYLAMWSKDLDKFVYLRSKFGDEFFETIEHPADDLGFDIFHVQLKVDPNDYPITKKFGDNFEKWLSRTKIEYEKGT